MTEIPLSLFAFAGAGVHAVHLGPKDPKRFNAQVLAQCVAGVLYGCAIGDAIGVGSEYMSPNEVMTHYPSLAERVHFESASTSVLQCSFALTSEGSMVEIESPSISTLPPAAAPTHPTLQFPIQYSEFIRDRHRIRWETGDWTEKTDLAFLLLSSVIRKGVFNEYSFADILTRYKYEGVTFFEDTAGFGLVNTLNILANTASYTHNPIECSEAVWIGANKNNLESQCIPHTLLLSILFFDDDAKVSENAIGCCKTTHYDLRCIGICLLLSRVLCYTLMNKDGVRESSASRKNLVFSCYSNVKTYFSEPQASMIMKEILEVSDDWNSVLRIVDTIQEGGIGEVFECCLYALFFYIYDYPFINAMMRIFVQGGSSAVNCCVTGALIGAKIGADEVALSAPVGMRCKG
ncbi:hypothetical protein WA556_006933 [Blastocystis sp. ATCC 50177/Nand II]